jgi:hypothetical protein
MEFLERFKPKFEIQKELNVAVDRRLCLHGPVARVVDKAGKPQQTEATGRANDPSPSNMRLTRPGGHLAYWPWDDYHASPGCEGGGPAERSGST